MRASAWRLRIGRVPWRLLPPLGKRLATLALALARLLPIATGAMDANARDGARAEEPGPVARGALDVPEARSLGCLACHADDVGADERRAARLTTVGARLTPQAIRTRLDGHVARGSGSRAARFDAFGALAPELREGAREDVLHFLVSLGGPLEPDVATVEAGVLDRGRLAFHRIGCSACHEPRESVDDLESFLWTPRPVRSVDADEEAEAAASRERAPWSHVPLPNLARSTSTAALAQFLSDPLSSWPSGRMPDLDLSADEAQELAAYLRFDPASGTGERLPGLAVECFEAEFEHPETDFDTLTPTSHTVVAAVEDVREPREDAFGVRLRGFLEVEHTGDVTFWLASDDGARLWIDGALELDNNGTHPLMESHATLNLDRGLHALEVTWYEVAGGQELRLEWGTRQTPRGPIPASALSHARYEVGTAGRTGWESFRVDPQRAASGAELARALRCANCHEVQATAAVAAEPWSRVRARSGEGCRGGPRYADVSAGALAPDAASEGEADLARSLEDLGCLACHERGGRGGPPRLRQPSFTTVGEADLGDQGRLPPTLDGVGAKLRADWLVDVLCRGGRARPYMRTRMPNFGVRNGLELAHRLTVADANPADDAAPAFSTDAVADGRVLAGTRGLGCIQCHTFAGHASLGIPAVDLSRVTRRIRPAWFRKLLADPVALGMNSRMPEFWKDGSSPVRDVCDGDPLRQIDALWSYLSLGESAPLPEGLVVPEEAYEVHVGDEPRLLGVFMRSMSPRTLAVGYPERIHVAFDVQDSRLGLAWRGRFFNARGTWEGRAGALEWPPSDDVLEFPAAAPFARLRGPGESWPTQVGRDAGFAALGRRFDGARRPVFRYAWTPPNWSGGAGARLEIEEVALPSVRAGATWITRHWSLRGASPSEDVWLLAAVGSTIERGDDGAWTVDGRVRVEAPPSARVHSTGALARGLELRVPVTPAQGQRDGPTELEVAYTW